MSRKNGIGQKVEVKLNLSPVRGVEPVVESDSGSRTSSPISFLSSCLSSEADSESGLLQYSSSPEATSMIVVGCPRCLMYVMLSEHNPKCPKCKSTVLLEFGDDSNIKKTKKN